MYTSRLITVHIYVYTTLTISNLVKEILDSSAPEGRGTNEHLVEDHAHRPPVDGEPVALSEDDLRGNVVRGTVNLAVSELPLTCVVGPGVLNHMGSIYMSRYRETLGIDSNSKLYGSIHITIYSIVFIAKVSELPCTLYTCIYS